MHMVHYLARSRLGGAVMPGASCVCDSLEGIHSRTSSIERNRIERFDDYHSHAVDALRDQSEQLLTINLWLPKPDVHEWPEECAYQFPVTETLTSGTHTLC